ncbi:RNA polymerase factor sigma-54 [Temperatibacter marinus]|uniref:RNA polymerase sigma-54 factor n=1 Tax=Temperatibacter marinus TaxID=1456591 RepID=A0AA52EKK8_9PROT|nr:RNA polymerase factor sigma-54 [Temperatibacter marinus]WND03731.1 RNA polymerase factor sigma-54 [Temperatibacter marinus]
MALTPRLDLKQSQQLVMTPQLQQAIKLLQLSNLELADFVAAEVERNPMLEVGDPNDFSAGEVDRPQDSGTAELLTEGGSDGGDGSDGLIAADNALNGAVDTMSSAEGALDANMSLNIYNNDSVSDRVEKTDTAGEIGASGSLSYDGGGAVQTSGGYSGENNFEAMLADGENLHDSLTSQMMVTLKDPIDRLIATHLIDLVDESGYINGELADEVAERLGAASEDIDRILEGLQTLEPAGVCARNLEECLAIQLKDLDRYDPAMQALVENLPLLARREMTKLKKLCGVGQDDLTDMIREIRQLNPKPGLAFGGESVQPVVPDIFVFKNKAGLWSVELNTDTLPKVLVNNSYVSELSETATGKEAKAFISDCVSGANWLVKALDQRARTILKVASALIKHQESFFQHGIRFLKPLTLKDIAEEIDMHESTVSRVTNNKFMSCPRGMFELKYFFTSSIAAGDGGDAHSSESVKFRIKELIDAEDPKKILSDDKLVDILKKEGIDIARRTVAKYREALKIPSSVQRRRQKNI